MLTLVNQACSITVCSYRGEVVTMSYLGRCSCCPIVEYLSWHQSTTTSAIYNHCTGEIVRTKVHIIVLCPCLFHRDFNIQRSLRDHYHVLSSASDIGRYEETVYSHTNEVRRNDGVLYAINHIPGPG